MKSNEIKFPYLQDTILSTRSTYINEIHKKDVLIKTLKDAILPR